MLFRSGMPGSKNSSFNLSIFITSLSTEKSVEVTGDTHIGKLMLDLVEGLGKLNLILKSNVCYLNYGAVDRVG